MLGQSTAGKGAIATSVSRDTTGFDVALTNPLLGLAGVAFGTITAILAVPSDCEPSGALRFSAILMSLGLCFGPALSMAGHPKSMVRAEHVLVLSPVFWLLLDMIQGRYALEGVREQDVVNTFTAIGLFAAGIWAAAMTLPWRLPSLILKAATEEVPARTYFAIGVLAFTLAFLRFAIPANFDLVIMWEGLTGNRWGGAWARGSLGGADAILDHFSYFGYVLPLLTVVNARFFGWLNYRTIFLLSFTLIIAAFLAQGGSRRIIGVLFGSGIVFWFLSERHVSFRTVAGLGGAVVLLILIMELMLDYRGAGLRALFDSDIRREYALLRRDDSLIRVDDNFLRLAQTTAIFPEEHPYTTWKYVLWVAVRPIPRVLWQGKPLNPGFDLSEFLGKEGVSLSASVIGELFMAGGFIAVMLGGWFYGRIAGVLSQLLCLKTGIAPILIYSAGLLALFAGMRSMIELVLMSYVILGWLVLRSLHTFATKTLGS